MTHPLDVTWSPGVPAGRRVPEPAIQVHHHDADTVILRQAKSVNYEAPFIFLLIGRDRALLLDTGATDDPALFPLRATVDRILEERLGQRAHDGYELVVAHSHGHNDHVAADGQFADRPATTVVPVDEQSVRAFFGLGDTGSAGPATFDLGGRALEVLSTPGHHRAAIAIHDPWTGFLLTGDTVLPGRLFAFDFAAYLTTLDALVTFTETRTVTHVLGCHVEMTTTPGRDYPIGATYQPDERPLEMTVAQLVAVRNAAASVDGRRGVHRFDDFIIYNEPRQRDLARMTARGVAHKAASSAAGIWGRLARTHA